MLKGRYKAWVFSITLHVLILLIFAKHAQRVIVAPWLEPKGLMQAYVTVDLTTLPRLNIDVEKTPEEKAKSSQLGSATEPKSEDTASEVAEQPSYAAMNESTLSLAAQTNSRGRTMTNASTVATPTKEPEIVASEVSSRPFKKLNPYAPLPNMDVEYNQSTAHATGNLHSATNNASGVRITSPKEYSISSEATVLWENGDGSRRIEMLNGQCYGIDFNSVFGKSGVPSGSPRPCEDKEAALFKEIMNKWSKK
ncbi:hypothetical protein ACN9JF_00900 [Pseudoalteromonas lipolytica]|uniref:hypothetical protein n=1 Tax=Pseudoalteromonas lipolytica TaxID=570156 RepID=UPI003BA26C7E